MHFIYLPFSHPKVEPFEVCRLFLASLQLANNGNVEILQALAGEQDGGMSMKFLNRKQIHSTLTEYRAPSVHA